MNFFPPNQASAKLFPSTPFNFYQGPEFPNNFAITLDLSPPQIIPVKDAKCFFNTHFTTPIDIRKLTILNKVTRVRPVNVPTSVAHQYGH